MSLSKRIKNLIDNRFGRLVVLSYVDTVKGGRTRWKCECDCGKFTIVTRQCLISGNTKSCGCLYKELREKGMNLLVLENYERWDSNYNTIIQL